MAISRAEARRDLLFRLLQKYERSDSYGRPAMSRDVLLKLDDKNFPEAFAAEGREDLSELRDAALELGSRSVVRIDYATSWGDGVPRQLRVGANELDVAYAEAEKDGFEPLSVSLRSVAAHARQLAHTVPSWMQTFLVDLATKLDDADSSALGMQRERFKREWRDLLDVLTACAHLSRGVEGWERVVSEKIFSNSKRIGEIRSRVIDLLLAADPQWNGVEPDDASELLEAYGIRRKPGLIRCAASAQLHVGARTYVLDDFVPVAHLPETWRDAWVEGLANAGARCLTTIENEYPFLSYVEQRGGPGGLAADGEVVVYVAGFPTPGLVDALRALVDRCVGLTVRHWGDADVGGLRIWWFLRQRLGRNIRLFRTTREWFEAAARFGGRPLKSGELIALERFREQLTARQRSDDLDEAIALIDALLLHKIKIEQERA